MSVDVQFEASDVLAYSLPAHRSGWDGSVCAKAETWQCGASEWFRSQHCIGGQGCMSKAAFVEIGPVLRSADTDLLHVCDTVGWSKMTDQWLLLHGFPERSDADVSHTSIAESTLYGIYVLESAQPSIISATNVVNSSVESTGSHQAILKPYSTEWIRFPPDMSLVWDREAEIAVHRNRTGFVKRSTIDRLLDQAMQAAEDSRGTAHWNSVDHDRLVRFYNNRFELVHRLSESTNVWSAEAWETLSSLDVLYDQQIGLEADVAPRQKPPDPEAISKPAIPSSQSDASPSAQSIDTKKEINESTIMAPPTIDSDDYGPEILAFDVWLKHLQGNADTRLLSSDDMQVLCALLIAGELVLLEGPAMDDALDCLSDSLVSGALHESAPSPAMIEFDDLLDDRGRDRPTALEEARLEALANPGRPSITCFVGIDNAPFEFWMHALHRWSRSRHRPGNLLICATVAHDPERAAQSGLVRCSIRHQEATHDSVASLSNLYRYRSLAALDWTSLPLTNDPVEMLDKAFHGPMLWTPMYVRRAIRLQQVASALNCVDTAAQALLQSIDTATATVPPPTSKLDPQL